MGLISRVSSRTYRSKMPSNDYFQIENYSSMIKDIEKQITTQQREFNESLNNWGKLVNDLVQDVGVDISQITPEFEQALCHMQKGINVQTAYKNKIKSDLD